MDNELKEIKLRINSLLGERKVSQSELSGGCGSSMQVKLSRQLDYRKDVMVSIDVIILVLKRFTDISAEWLLLGTGNKTKEGSTVINNEYYSNNQNNGSTQIIGTGNSTDVEKLQAEIFRLQCEIARKDGIIEGLKYAASAK